MQIAPAAELVFDDFNAYRSQALLGEPWESVSGLWGHPAVGYQDTPGVTAGPTTGHTRGRAYLATQGVRPGDRLVGRLFLHPATTEQRAMLHLSSATTDASLRTVGFFFAGTGTGAATLSLTSSRLDGNGKALAAPAVQSLHAEGLSPGTWYDVRMTVGEDLTSFHGEYRESGAEDWIEIGTISGAYASWETLDTWKNHFSPNYLNMQAMRGGYLDDVGMHPRPLSFPLITEGPGARPAWVDRWAARKSPAWRGWRNTLRPDGPATPLTLSENGSTEYVIVLPEAETPAERKAAEELRMWLGKMTGADFPIVSDREPARARELSVGRTARLAEARLPVAEQELGEGYAIVVRAERVFLLGGQRAGPFYAVMALLEEDLDCRWYAPGVHRIPSQPTLQVPIASRTVTPPLRIRDMVHYSNTPWYARNRFNLGRGQTAGGFPENYTHPWISYSHSFADLVPRKYLAEHPEYFALIGGRRRGPWTDQHGQLCLSHPEVPVVAARTVSAALRRNPPGPWQSLSIPVLAMDWRGDCQCPDCLAWVERTGTADVGRGARGGLTLLFANRMADLLKEEFPQVTVDMSVYWQQAAPPAAPLRARENVLMTFWTDWGTGFEWPYHSLRDGRMAERFQRWMEIFDNRFHAVWYPQQYRNHPAPMPNTHAVAENIRYFAEKGAGRMELLLFPDLWFYHWDGGWMRPWVWSKLLWDPSLDVDELMQDFIWGYYGDAAPHVAAYHELLLSNFARHADLDRRRDWVYPVHDEEFLQHDFVPRARVLLDRAAQAADSEEIRLRVEMLKLPVVYTETVLLHTRLRGGDPLPDRAHFDAVLAEFTDLYERLRTFGSEAYAAARPNWKVNRKIQFYDGKVIINDFDLWKEEIEKDWRRREALAEVNAQVTRLGDVWRFAVDPRDAGRDEEWFAVSHDDRDWMDARSDRDAGWVRQGLAPDYIGAGWYRQSFRVPEDFDYPHRWLLFEGVDENAWVFINGHRVMEHSTQSTGLTPDAIWSRPFPVPLENAGVAPGREMHLAVRVTNTMGDGGIHRPVWLIGSRQAIDPEILPLLIIGQQE